MENKPIKIIGNGMFLLAALVQSQQENIKSKEIRFVAFDPIVRKKRPYKK